MYDELHLWHILRLGRSGTLSRAPLNRSGALFREDNKQWLLGSLHRKPKDRQTDRQQTPAHFFTGYAARTVTVK